MYQIAMIRGRRCCRIKTLTFRTVASFVRVVFGQHIFVPQFRDFSMILKRTRKVYFPFKMVEENWNVVSLLFLSQNGAIISIYLHFP